MLGIVVLLSLGVALAVHTHQPCVAPTFPLIHMSCRIMPGLSIVRMAAAYLLSLLFALWYGRAAARNHRIEHVLMPLLDVLQSVPILSFLPVVLLSLSAVLPQQIAAELAAIVLIFTSQAWNLVFAWYGAQLSRMNSTRRPAFFASMAGCVLRPWNCPLLLSVLSGTA